MNRVRFPRPSVALRVALLALLLATTLPPSSWAQVRHASELTEFNAGDITYRTFVHFEFDGEWSPQVVLIPGDGLDADLFRTRPDGRPGWGVMLRERGHNVYMLDNVGCGHSIDPPSRDFAVLMEMAQFGVEQIGAATQPLTMIAHGQAAGLALKSRSQQEKAGKSLVLVDPIGPKGSQPLTDLTPADVMERWQDRNDWNWRRWGFGKRFGDLRRGVDVTEEVARQVVEGYQADQPAYWTGLLTTMDSGMEVRTNALLRDLPVLVVRTPAADREQIAREEAVVAWMESMEMRVDRLDLSDDPELKHLSGLPWIGDLAEPALDRIMAWVDGLGIAPPSAPGR